MKPKALLLPLFLALLSLTALRGEEKSPVALEVKVPGMKCAGCAFSVTEELKKLDHVTEVYVDPKSKKALLSVDSADSPGKEAILAAVKAAGYEATGFAKLEVSFAEAKAALTGEKG